MDELLKKVIANIEIIHSHPIWNKDEWRSIYEILYGVAVGLCACRFTVEKRRLTQQKYKDTVRKLPKTLHYMLLSNADNLDWFCEPFSIWSAGFFLNKAQINLAASLDRSLNLLIVENFNSIEPEEDLYLSWPVTRARFIRSVMKDTQINKYLQTIEHGFENFAITKGKCNLKKPTTKFWVDLANKCNKLSNLKAVVKAVNEYNNSGIYLAAVCDRVNWFKHYPLGGGIERQIFWGHVTKAVASVQAMVEWSVTLQALTLTARFVKCCSRKSQGQPTK